MIALSELHLGPCKSNQNLTIEYFENEQVWRVIIKLLTNNTSKNAIHVREYVLDVILSLTDGGDQHNLEKISTLINYKII